MDESTKQTLLALIKGITKNKGNQYYTEYYIDENWTTELPKNISDYLFNCCYDELEQFEEKNQIFLTNQINIG